MGLGLGFALGGAQAGMDERRVKDIQDAEIQHTKERRAIVEPLQDQALKAEVQNATDTAQYRREDRPLERQTKEQAVATGGLQLESATKKLPLELQAQKMNNKILGITTQLQQLHLGNATQEAANTSMQLHGQLAYGISALTDINPAMGLKAFNDLPETKASGVQAAKLGFESNQNDPKDKERYLVARDAQGNVVTFKGPNGQTAPAMFKQSALSIYAPKFEQYDVKDIGGKGVIYSKVSGANAPVSGLGLPVHASDQAAKLAVDYWGKRNELGQISFDGENQKYAGMNAALTTKLMAENPNMDPNDAHLQALTTVRAQKTRDEGMSSVSGQPGGTPGNQADYSHLWSQ
jgi:hypothetical protein